MSDPNPDTEIKKLELERQKHEADTRFREREPMRKGELAQKKKSGSAFLSSPAGVAIIAGMVTLVGTILTSIRGCAETRLQQEKYKSEFELERHKFESSLILKAIEDSSNPEEATEYLRFLVESGLIESPSHLDRMTLSPEVPETPSTGKDEPETKN